MSHICPAPNCHEIRPTAGSLAKHTAACPLFAVQQASVFAGVRTRRQAQAMAPIEPSSTLAPTTGPSLSTQEQGDDMDIDDERNWEAVKEKIPKNVQAPPRPTLRRSARLNRRVPREVNDLVPPEAVPNTAMPAVAPQLVPAPAAAPVEPVRAKLARTTTNKFGIYKLWRRYPFASPPPNEDGFVSDIPTFTKPSADKSSSWWQGFGRLRDGFLKGKTVDTVCDPLPNSSVFRLVQQFYTGMQDRSVRAFNYFVRHVLKAKDFNIDDVPDDFDVLKECKKLDGYEEDAATDPFMHSSSWRKTTVEFPMSCEHVKHASEARAPRLKVEGVLHRSLIEVITSAFQGPDSASYQYTPVQAFWQPSPDKKPERPGRPDMPTAVAAMMFYSDGTHLANFGSASLWPFYLFFGNQSKYARGKPNQYAAHHVAYIPVLPADLQEKYKAAFPNQEGASAPTITQLKRELMHAIWKLLLQDPKFLDAYENGIVIRADYPEKALLASIRPLAHCGCPTCLTEKEWFHELGTQNDSHRRKRVRVDDAAYRERIDKAQKRIFKEGVGVTGKKVEDLLDSRSEVPIRNAFSETLAQFSFNFYTMFVPDLLHEFELGVWKALFSHLICILHAAPGNLTQTLNERYRLVPTFGRGTIRRFSHNASAMKKLAARDFEDLLQCALPVFENLLPEHNTIILDMLFVLCCWHAYSKLRLHTTSTISAFGLITRALGMHVRRFRSKVCSQFQTRDLPTEEAARVRRQQRQKAKKGTTASGSEASTKRKAKLRKLNLNTFKFHNLGHYIMAILQFGTTDNYSTQTGEQEHRRVKQFYVHTNKMRAFSRQIARHYRRQRLLAAIAVRYEIANLMNPIPPPKKTKGGGKARNLARVPNSEPDILPARNPTARYQIARNENFPVKIEDTLVKHAGDPAFIDFHDNLRSYILARCTLPRQERSEAVFSDNDLARVVFNKGPHRYWYGRLCGVYHADVTILDEACRNPEKRARVEFLWVRWFGRLAADENGNRIPGLEEGRLQRVAFIDTDIENSGAFGFVDPEDVILLVHMVPAFAYGRTTEYMGLQLRVMRERRIKTGFSDRDMVMRFCGGGPGHGPPVGEYPLQPARLYAKKSSSAQAQQSSKPSADLEDVEMGDPDALASDAESEEFCKELAVADAGEDEEDALVTEMQDYEYQDLDEVRDSSDEDDTDGEGGDGAQDILNERTDCRERGSDRGRCGPDTGPMRRRKAISADISFPLPLLTLSSRSSQQGRSRAAKRKAPAPSRKVPPKRSCRRGRRARVIDEDEEDDDENPEFEEPFEDEAMQDNDDVHEQDDDEVLEDEMDGRSCVSLCDWLGGTTRSDGNRPFEPYKFVVQHIMRTHCMFLSFEQVVFVHNRIRKGRYAKLDNGRKLTKERFLHMYAREKAAAEILAARVEDFDEDFEEVVSNQLLRALGRKMDAAAKSARGWDIGGLVLEGMLPGECATQETHRPWSPSSAHSGTDRAPSLHKAVLEDYEAVRNKIVNRKISITGEEFPMFLYRDLEYDDKDPEHNLLISEALFTFWRHIFSGPASAAPVIPGEPPRKPAGQVELNKMTSVTPGSIAYASELLWWTICELGDWRHTNSFDRKKFYDSVLGLFDDPDDVWVKDTLARWNQEMFREEPENVDYVEPQISSVDLIQKKREARKAAAAEAAKAAESTSSASSPPRSPTPSSAGPTRSGSASPRVEGGAEDDQDDLEALAGNLSRNSLLLRQKLWSAASVPRDPSLARLGRLSLIQGTRPRKVAMCGAWCGRGDLSGLPLKKGAPHFSYPVSLEGPMLLRLSPHNSVEFLSPPGIPWLAERHSRLSSCWFNWHGEAGSREQTVITTHRPQMLPVRSVNLHALPPCPLFLSPMTASSSTLEHRSSNTMPSTQVNLECVPTELKELIVSYCARSALPNLALTSKTFQALAEKRLYAQITVFTVFDGFGGLETLEFSVARASYVKFLSVEYSQRASSGDGSIIESVLRAGPSLKNLKDLRIKLPRRYTIHVDLPGRICTLLCGGHFKVTRLFVNDSLDLIRIVNALPSLRVLGIYQSTSYGAAQSLLSSLPDKPLLFLGLDRDGPPFQYYNWIVLVPQLLDRPMAEDFATLVQEAFSVHNDGEVRFDHEEVVHLVIMLRDAPSREDDIFLLFMQNAARFLSSTRELYIHLEACDLGSEHGRIEPVHWPNVEKIAFLALERRRVEGGKAYHTPY
ncbi:hypothetical protein NMY22_g10092 [Coprinellus aureogranulatus]|nr:hypothetical protein NMY22_g10092 [Coprinellus aureogranulatus]